MSIEDLLRAIAENPRIALADLVSTLEDKAARHGAFVGFVAGAAVTAAVAMVWVYLVKGG